MDPNCPTCGCQKDKCICDDFCENCGAQSSLVLPNTSGSLVTLI